MALEITSGSRRAHKTKQKTHYYKITKALIKKPDVKSSALYFCGERTWGTGREPVQVNYKYMKKSKLKDRKSVV